MAAFMGVPEDATVVHKPGSEQSRTPRRAGKMRGRTPATPPGRARADPCQTEDYVLDVGGAGKHNAFAVIARGLQQLGGVCEEVGDLFWTPVSIDPYER